MTHPLRTANPGDAPGLAANAYFANPETKLSIATLTERIATGEKFPIDTYRVIEDTHGIIGQARTVRMTCWLGGKQVQAGGLAGVSVAPHARRRGIASALVRDHLHQLHEARVGWAFLYPFASSFYQGFGWSPFAQRLRWRLSPQALPQSAVGNVVPLNLADRHDQNRVQAVYDAYCVQQNGSLSRTIEQMRGALHREGHFAVGVTDGARALRGYCIYRYDAPTPRPLHLDIVEWLALDGDSERALLQFMANHADQICEVWFDTPLHAPLTTLLSLSIPNHVDHQMPEDHTPVAQLFSGAMARIVSLQAALAERGYPQDAVGVINIAARDIHLRSNERPMHLCFEHGRGYVELGHAPGAPMISGPVNALAAIFGGALALAEAVRWGQVQLDGAIVPAWQRMLTLPAPYALFLF